MKNKLVHYSIIGIFCSLYFLVATISMINSVAFFNLAHDGIMNWALAIGFELGAAASLAAIIILDKTNKAMVWTLFILLTAFQMMANSFHAFINLEDYVSWIELFGLEEAEPIVQKRVLSIVSGAILPIVALGFIKSLVDYIRPESEKKEKDIEVEDEEVEDPLEEPLKSEEYLFTLQEDETIQEPKKAESEVLVDIPLKYAESYVEPVEKKEVKEDTIEEFDEDHALDIVLNDMVEDDSIYSEEDLKNMKEWEEASLTDFLELEEEHEKIEQIETTKEAIEIEDKTEEKKS